MIVAGSVITSKLRNRFESGLTSPAHDAKPAFSKGLQKSSTVSDIGNALQNSFGQNAERQRVRTGLAENYFKSSEKVAVKEGNVMSPAVQRVQAIEKSKSFSKFKNAFESGKGLNQDSSDDENVGDYNGDGHYGWRSGAPTTGAPNSPAPKVIFLNNF